MSKATCAICNKSIGQFKCEGCSQMFCTKHVAEHRRELNGQFEGIMHEYDILQEEIKQDADHHHHRLMAFISQWEEKSVEKIQQTAKNMREKIKQSEETYRKKVREELDQLRKQIEKACGNDDFLENDLRNWSTKLEQLKRLKATVLSEDIKEDQTSTLIHQIQFDSVSSHSVSSSVNQLHPRLKYINRDGVYVNPKSFFVTAIWYFYSSKTNRWFWTPYENYESWIPVDSVVVRSGYYKNQVPASINVETIEYLRRNNPIPPDDILHVASEAENRILKLKT